ncbi:STM4015 family protein [Streptosporangium sp. NPDC049376]|uniref:STM4015 family protein n=1 Tax=Streptosporangium sp. NPDC049376 TaxID=3366192 RepID=UPI00378DD2B5
MFIDGNEMYVDNDEYDRYLDALYPGKRAADPRDPGERFLHEDGFYRWDRMGGHRETYAGLPVAGFRMLTGRDTVPDPSCFAWPLHGGEMYEEADGPGFTEGLEKLLTVVDGSGIQAIVVAGISARDAPAVLVANAHRLPRLRSLFLGFVEPDYQISWIQQGDITPILEAFPLLERLDVRGSEGLRLRPVRHASLKVLRFETGGLPGEVVRALGRCDLPALEHLELWLGVTEYGGGATVNDLEGVLSGAGLPALRRLGLRDSEIQDEVAAAVAAAPVVARLEALSLAMGELSDAGAEALLSGQPLTHLRHLDLHHHFLSEEMAKRIRRVLPDVELDLSEPQAHLRTWRYVAVAE